MFNYWIIEYVALSRLNSLDGLGISILKHQRFTNNNLVYQPAYDDGNFAISYPMSAKFPEPKI